MKFYKVLVTFNDGSEDSLVYKAKDQGTVYDLVFQDFGTDIQIDYVEEVLDEDDQYALRDQLTYSAHSFQE